MGSHHQHTAQDCRKTPSKKYTNSNKNSYPSHFIPNANPERSLLPRSEPQQHHQAPPTPPGRAPHFRAINHSTTPQKHRVDPRPQQGSAAPLPLSGRLQQGFAGTATFPCRMGYGVPSMLQVRLGKPVAELDQRGGSAPINLCVSLHRPQNTSVFHCTDPNTSLRFTACAGREAHQHLHTAQPPTQARAPRVHGESRFFLLLLRSTPDCSQPSATPSPPASTSPGHSSCQEQHGGGAGKGQSRTPPPMGTGGRPPPPCSTSRILLHPQPKSHRRHRPALIPSLGKYPQFQDNTPSNAPPPRAPGWGVPTRRVSAGIYFRRELGRLQQPRLGGGSQLGPELLYLKALAAARRPSPLAQGSRPKKQPKWNNNSSKE